MEEAITIDELLSRNPILFSDCSIDPGSTEWYRRIYRSHRFATLDRTLLNQVVNSAEALKEWFSKPSVLTTRAICQELERFRDIIYGKLRSLYRNEIPKARKSYGEQLFERIATLYDEIAGLAKQCAGAFAPDPVKFQAIERLVMAVAENTDAKRNYHKEYGDAPSQRQDLHGSESLVAAALYVSLIDGEPCSVISPGSNSIRLLSWAHKLAANNEMPGGRDIYESMRDKPILIYFIKRDGIRRAVDTAKYTFFPRFELPGKDGPTMSRVKQDIEAALVEAGLAEKREYFRV